MQNGCFLLPDKRQTIRKDIRSFLVLLPIVIAIIGFSTAALAASALRWSFKNVFLSDGTLPDDVTSISISGPNSAIPLAVCDFTFYPPNQFFYMATGSPAIGTYTFTATVAGVTLTAFDTQSVIREIPVIDPSHMMPAAV